MNIYLLTSLEGCDYDETAGLVVRASSPRAARALAGTHCSTLDAPGRWASTARSSCTLLKPSGKPTVILTDFRAG
jgi:hypothetical protein